MLGWTVATGRDAALAQPDDPRWCRDRLPRPAHLLRPRRLVHLCWAGYEAQPRTSCRAPRRRRARTWTASTSTPRCATTGRTLPGRRDGSLVGAAGSDYPFPLGEEHVGGYPACAFPRRRRRLLGGSALDFLDLRSRRSGSGRPVATASGSPGRAWPVAAASTYRRGHDVTLYERRRFAWRKRRDGPSTSRSRPAASTPSSGSVSPTTSWATGWR
jgi:hypothetical protein